MTVRGGGGHVSWQVRFCSFNKMPDMYRNSTLPNLSFGESRSATRARTRVVLWLAAWMLAWMLAWAAILI